MSNAHSSTSSNNIVGVHYRVGKKIGEGSFGVIFEGAQSLVFVCAPCSGEAEYVWATIGTNLLNSQTVAIKFVRAVFCVPSCSLLLSRSMFRAAGQRRGRARRLVTLC